MVVETRKILATTRSTSSPTCVRVPVFVGHSEAINLEFEDPITVEEAREALEEAPGIVVLDRPDQGEYMTPVECVGEHATFVSRLRKDPTVPTACRCGSSRTICARVRRSMPCRSRRPWSRTAIFDPATVVGRGPMA